MKTIFPVLLFFFAMQFTASAEDGHQLWLGNRKQPRKVTVGSSKSSPTLKIAKQELQDNWRGDDGATIVFTIKKDSGLKKDGFRLAKNSIQANSELGILYGVYELLRQQQTNVKTASGLPVNPSYDLRILNHWDNLDGTIERGYAGRSIFWRENDPFAVTENDKKTWTEYARANASIGINGTVLNNVNASPAIIQQNYLRKVKIMADIFRPYGLKVYLSVNFSSPKILGGLPDSDPLNARVQQWWSEKAKEIYGLIPDFGGFLVKANSEGQPGPQDYGRTHAEGANMLAKALKPYGGIVMWRAFVYAPDSRDRAKQAYSEFMPLDGKFDDNVIVQVKNGPIDFQPREPFTPLFGAMRKTPLMIEFQITQEYLGFSNHLVYLAPLFEECLRSETYSDGEGSTLAKITDGTLRPAAATAIAGVANIGRDANWTGHHFAQANWYAFGRLAWNDTLTAEQIADEWLRLTFSAEQDFINPIKKMMLASRETLVNYMMPLGLHHIFAEGHHYGPQPWLEKAGRADWTSAYYHKADKSGIGFNRTVTGSNAVSQYYSPLKELFNDPRLCPDKYLLWFHHLPWTFKMENGNTLWDEICHRYDNGVKGARDFQMVWDTVEKYVDRQRFGEVQYKLKTQTKDAVWWKDACLLYFQTFSGMPIPYDIERPVHDLGELKQINLNLKHHN